MKPNNHASLNFCAGIFLFLALSSVAVAQSTTGGAVPFVTIQATEPIASGPGNPGVFTVYRHGGTNAALNVFYDIGGTASNGVDYVAISQWVAIPAGAMSNNVVITPIESQSSVTKSVLLQLAQPPTLNPVNFGIGVPSNAVVYLTPAVSTNHPPVVRITSPPNGSVLRAPMDIPIYAYAADPDGTVSSVQFFAGTQSLGFGQQVTAIPLPLPPGPVQPPILIVVSNYWEFVWTNPPPGTNLTLTAVATDNSGLVATSAPVLVSILPPLLPPPPPPTNVVTIVATDPIAIAGTNCWTWPGPVSPVAAWSNSLAAWSALGAPCRIFTNCGPKDATITVFRFGGTNALAVTYAIGGTASNGVDYVTLPGTVTVPAGERSAAITIVPLDDESPGLIKTVVLTLTGTNYVVGFPRSAAAIILDSRSPQPVAGVTPDRCFNIAAAGPSGAWFHVEYSTNLVNWTPICTNQVFNGNVEFVDPDAVTNAARFYRTVPEAGPPQ